MTELICINCPRGCNLHVEQNGDDFNVTGHSCPKGVTYAQQELTHPVRVLTVLMRVQGCSKPLSVRTDKPVPRDMLMKCAQEIYRTHPAPPVKRGDVLITDLLGTGANVVATTDSRE